MHSSETVDFFFSKIFKSYKELFSFVNCKETFQMIFWAFFFSNISVRSFEFKFKFVALTCENWATKIKVNRLCQRNQGILKQFVRINFGNLQKWFFFTRRKWNNIIYSLNKTDKIKIYSIIYIIIYLYSFFVIYE